METGESEKVTVVEKKGRDACKRSLCGKGQERADLVLSPQMSQCVCKETNKLGPNMR